MSSLDAADSSGGEPVGKLPPLPSQPSDDPAIDIDINILRRAQRQTKMQHRELQYIISSPSLSSSAPSIDLSSITLPPPSPSASSALATYFQSLSSLVFFSSSPPPLNLSAFELAAAPHTLVLHSIPIATLQQHEQRLLGAKQDEKAQRTGDFINKLKRLAVIEQQELDRVDAHFHTTTTAITARSAAMATEAQRIAAQQRKAMTKLSNRLRAIISAQRETVEAAYGHLTLSGNLSLPKSLPALPSLPPLSSLRSLSAVSTLLPWPSPILSRVPRVLSIRIHSLRAIKNKLPPGEYSVLCTLLTSIATGEPCAHPGRVIRQYRLPLKSVGGAGGRVESVWVRHYDWTREPKRHSGKYYATELSFSGSDNAIHIALPAQDDSTLSLCLLFELVALRGHEQPKSKPNASNPAAAPAGAVISLTTPRGKKAQSAASHYATFYRSDAVIAFGFLPVINPTTAALVTGKLKFPLLRGFQRRDHRISCYGDVRETMERSLDAWLCNAYAEVAEVGVTRRSGYWVMDADEEERGRLKARDELRRREAARLNAIDLEAKRRMRQEQQTQGWGGFFKELRKPTPSLPSTSPAPPPTTAVGMAGKIDSIGRSIVGIENSAEGKEMHKRQQVRDKIRELRQYRHAVLPNNHQHLHLLPASTSRGLLTSFVLRETWNGLKYRQGAEVTAVLNVCLLVLVFLLRIAVHYFAQWIVMARVLQLDLAAVTVYPPLSAVFQLADAYDASALARSQVLVCLVGPFGCYIVLVFLSVLLTMLSAVAVPVPALVYTFSLLYAALCVLDPLWIILVDALAGRLAFNEFVLLFQYYSALQQPFTPLLLLIPFALLLLVLPALLLLLYVLRVHHHRALYDLFLRLYEGEGMLPLPKDLEVTVRLVRGVLRESASWKGARGGRRKVMLNEYWRMREAAADGQGATAEERCLHLSIWTVTKRKTVDRDKHDQQAAGDDDSDKQHEEKEAQGDGQDKQSAAAGDGGALGAADVSLLRDSDREDRELYRHFLRFSDGSWIECLDGVESYGGDVLGKKEREWLDEQEKQEKGREDDDRRNDHDDDDEDNGRRTSAAAQEAEQVEPGRIRTVPRVNSFGVTGEGRKSVPASTRSSVTEGKEQAKDSPGAEPAAGYTFLSVDVGASGDGVGRGRMPSLLHQTIAEDEDEEEEEENDE